MAVLQKYTTEQILEKGYLEVAQNIIKEKYNLDVTGAFISMVLHGKTANNKRTIKQAAVSTTLIEMFETKPYLFTGDQLAILQNSII